MDIRKRVEEVLDVRPEQGLNSTTINSLEEFYKRMLEAGIAKKAEYTLPPLDTIGRRLHAETKANTIGNLFQQADHL